MHEHMKKKKKKCICVELDGDRGGGPCSGSRLDGVCTEEGDRVGMPWSAASTVEEEKGAVCMRRQRTLCVGVEGGGGTCPAPSHHCSLNNGF